MRESLKELNLRSRLGGGLTFQITRSQVPEQDILRICYVQVFHPCIRSTLVVCVLFHPKHVDNRIGDKGLESITSVLRRINPSPCPSLVFLDISSHLIECRITYRHEHYGNRRCLYSQTNSSHRRCAECSFRSYCVFQCCYDKITRLAVKVWDSFSLLNTGKPSRFSVFYECDGLCIDTKVNDSFDLFAKSTHTKSYNLKHLAIKSKWERCIMIISISLVMWT